MSDEGLAFATLDASGDERFVSIRRQLGVSSFGINLIVLQPRQQGRIHAHEHQEEVYIVMEGELTLTVGPDTRHVLGAGEAVRVAPAVRRQLSNAGSERLVLLALGGAGEHAGRDGRAWESWEQGGEGRAPQEVPLPDDLPA
jgi:mannose-6-phosphate isomerase-like protein (cupin superfamily)